MSESERARIDERTVSVLPVVIVAEDGTERTIYLIDPRHDFVRAYNELGLGRTRARIPA